MTRAGGYIRISVSAKPNITCVPPTGLPLVTFGSGGTQGRPAEQSTGSQITLSGGTTVRGGCSSRPIAGRMRPAVRQRHGRTAVCAGGWPKPWWAD